MKVEKNMVKKNDTFPQNVYLIIDSQVYSIIGEITNLGRKLDNDIVIHDEIISRKHAKICYESGQFVIYDKHSTSGILVNNKKINRCVLFSGDVISLGSFEIMFVDNDQRLKELETAPTKSLD
jgi:pSer/pThr/pTyr-binding forkhead associated (FHA) protein